MKRFVENTLEFTNGLQWVYHVKKKDPKEHKDPNASKNRTIRDFSLSSKPQKYEIRETFLKLKTR